jgi:hypothetical protein
MRTIMPAFREFAEEAKIIGRLLAGYAELEIGLLNCVQIVRDDFDTVLKALFRIRGESNRIRVGDAFGRHTYADLGLQAEFEAGIGAMRHCVKIRNQYAHCNWYDDNSGKLAFANLEDAARLSAFVTDLRSLQPGHVDVALLQEQEAFFGYTDDIFRFVNHEGRKLAGKLASNPFSMPTQIPPPPLHLP